MHKERRVRLFRNGRNQAVRIPRALELPGDEAMLHQEDGRLVIEPVLRQRNLREVLATLQPLDEQIPELEDPVVADEDIF